MGVRSQIAEFPAEIRNTLRMKPIQALVWFCCWSCWTLGSLQFYVLPFELSNLAKYLDVAQTKISEANTTTMISRLLGAIIFGIAADQFGRKIPLMINLLLMGIFTLGAGFIQNYGQLIGLRLLFGVTYGGTYGMVMATVLEAVPKRSRGIVSGITQQGFSAGYLLASGLHLAMNPYGWRSLFWLAAGLTVPVMILRFLTPYYSVATHAIEEAEDIHGQEITERIAVGGDLSFLMKLKFVLRHHTKSFFYACCVTSCLATMGHGAMDLYPTFLTTQRHLNIKQETWVTVILQIGGIAGGLVGGYLSHRFSPKWVACIAIILCAPWLPLWVLPTQWNHLAAGAFFLQFFYGCAIGNVGNILQQLCPHPGMRAAFGGVAYNVGNAVSSVAPTIETALGERFPTADGKPDYARTQLILVGIVICLFAIALALMPLQSLNKEWDTVDPNSVIPQATDGASKAVVMQETQTSPTAKVGAEDEAITQVDTKSRPDAMHIENV